MPEDGGGPADGGAKPTLTEFKISVDSLLIEVSTRILLVFPFINAHSSHVLLITFLRLPPPSSSFLPVHFLQTTRCLSYHCVQLADGTRVHGKATRSESNHGVSVIKCFITLTFSLSLFSFVNCDRFINFNERGRRRNKNCNLHHRTPATTATSVRAALSEACDGACVARFATKFWHCLFISYRHMYSPCHLPPSRLLKQLQHNLLETGDKVEQQQSAHRDTAARPEF